MDKFVKLGQDMVLLWSKYKVMYWAGIWNTLKLAFLATLIGCFIGLLCGVLNTIPYTKKDPLPKRFLLKLLRIIIRIYVEVFREPPWCCNPCSFTTACPTSPITPSGSTIFSPPRS
ncbi:MAG: hypothetical protein ACLSHO_03340 [Dysosmobacter sp.]